jgi:pimeloyl-ACP methyl ester carboxylesterase
MPLLSNAGTQLFYKEAGSGPPILLIHGTSIDADTWGEAFDALAADHRVVAYDRRGHTRTREAGTPATGDWTLHTDDARAFIEQLDLAPATVVGWSGGGTVALRLAMERPDFVRNLVLVESVFDPTHNLTSKFVRTFLGCRLRFALRRDVAAYERFVRFVCTRRGEINTWDDPAFPEERRAVGRANLYAYRAESNAREHMPTAKDVGAIEMPTTVVLGEQSDKWFERMAVAVTKAIPQARLVRIPNANHAFGFTAPRELAEAIAEAARADVDGTVDPRAAAGPAS